MMNEMNYSYDAKFEGNISIVGRTGYGKTTFVQNLGKKEVVICKRSNLGVKKNHFQRAGKIT